MGIQESGLREEKSCFLVLPACLQTKLTFWDGRSEDSSGAFWFPCLIVFCFVHSGEGTESMVGQNTWTRMSVNTAGALCLSLVPDPEQFKMVWLFTEISLSLSESLNAKWTGKVSR